MICQTNTPQTIPTESLEYAAQAIAYMQEIKLAKDSGDIYATLDAVMRCANAHYKASLSGPTDWKKHHALSKEVVIAWGRAQLALGRVQPK